MTNYITKKLKRVEKRVEKYLKEVGYKIEHFSFCIVAARTLDYRFIIIIIPGLSFDELQKRIENLESWPSLGIKKGYGTKEIWIAKKDRKFDIYTYNGICWENKNGNRLDIKTRISKILIQKPSQKPRMARGHIDRINGCVYFLYSPNDNLVKIGKTTNLKERIKSHKTSLPNAKLLGYINTQTPYDLEADLHDRFSGDCVKGEWFEYSKEIRDYIERKANV